MWTGNWKIRQWLLCSKTWLSEGLYTQCSVLKARSSSSLPFRDDFTQPLPIKAAASLPRGLISGSAREKVMYIGQTRKACGSLKNKNLASVFQKRRDSLWQTHKRTLTPTCWVPCNHWEHHRNFENTYLEEALCLLGVQQELLVTVPQKAQQASMEANPSQNKLLPWEKGIFGPWSWSAQLPVCLFLLLWGVFSGLRTLLFLAQVLPLCLGLCPLFCIFSQ